MALSQEIRFKISGDTSGLDASFKRTESIAERAGRKLEAAIKARIPKGVKQGSAAYEFWGPTPAEMKRLERYREIAQKERADVSKAAAKGAKAGASGGGGVSGGGGDTAEQATAARSNALHFFGSVIISALHAANDFVRTRISQAQAQEESRAAGLASTRARIAAVGGLSGQLSQGQSSLRDLERDRDTAKSRAEFLSSPIQMALMAADRFGQGFKPLEEANKQVEDLNAKIQQQHDANALVERDLRRQNELRKTQFGFMGRWVGNTLKIDSKPSGSIAETGEAAASGGLNDVRQAQIELKRLRGVLAAERKYGTPDAQKDAQVAIEAQRVRLQQAQQSMGQRLLDVNQDLTGQAAEGRTFRNGRPRPRSETERLAQRALLNRERARQRALTGAGGDVGPLLQAAGRDEKSVADRLSAATSNVSGKDVADATSLKPEIVRSNQLLEAIKTSLEPVEP